MDNKKMSIIINCLTGEDFYATIRVSAPHCKFFQLTKTDMKKKYKIGTNKIILYVLNDTKKYIGRFYL